MKKVLTKGERRDNIAKLSAEGTPAGGGTTEETENFFEKSFKKVLTSLYGCDKIIKSHTCDDGP